MEAKGFIYSKTLWVGVLPLIAAQVNKEYGFVAIGAEDVATILGAIGIVLRLITKRPVSLSRLT